MNIPRSFTAAGAIAVAAVAYFLIRGFVGAAINANEEQPSATAGDTLPTVVADVPRFEERARIITLNGRTEAARVVTVRAEVTGTVAETPAREGGAVTASDVLCKLEVDAREARVAEAEATVQQRELELKAAAELANRGHRAANQLAAAQAASDAAEAALAQALLNLENLEITAPFDGVFDERHAEIGDFLSPGDSCGVVAELDPILVIAQAAELDAGYIKEGEQVRVTLATGEVFPGEVRFVQWRANPATRTYRVEVKAENTDRTIRSGATARVDITGPVRQAALVPSSVLILDDSGRLGVRVLDGDDTVRFRTIDVIEDTTEGVWVTGLDARERVIVRGQNFVPRGPTRASRRPRPREQRGSGMTGIVDFAISRARMTLVSLVVGVIAGLLVFNAMPKESDPDIPVPFVYCRRAAGRRVSRGRGTACGETAGDGAEAAGRGARAQLRRANRPWPLRNRVRHHF